MQSSTRLRYGYAIHTHSHIHVFAFSILYLCDWLHFCIMWLETIVPSRLTVIRAQNACQCILVHIFFVSCSGASVDHITTVSILSGCDYGNNCRGFSRAMSWCQNAMTAGLPNPRSTNQLNITNAGTSDNGVYQCCSVPACCSAGPADILDSTLNITVFSESVKVAIALAVFCV